MQFFSAKQGCAGAVVLVLAASVMSACSEKSETTPVMPNAEPRLNTETEVDGCGSTTSPCKVDGIVVKVTRNQPDSGDPPPAPPEITEPAYTPPEGGFGKPTKGGGGEITPAPLGVPYSDGPLAYVTCVAAATGLTYLQQTPEVVKAAENLHYAIDRLHDAETKFQMIRENISTVGEEKYLLYQTERDNAAQAYYDARRNLKRELDLQKASTWTAFALALAGCTPAWWIPYF